jgi:hypothetical protein
LHNFKKNIDKVKKIVYISLGFVVELAQLAERQIVALEAVGSSPIFHPINQKPLNIVVFLLFYKQKQHLGKN